MSTDIDNLVSELQLELDRIERVFTAAVDCHGSNTSQAGISPSKLSIFERHELDSEKEELQDRLNALLSQSEYYDQQMLMLQVNLLEITKRNEELRHENALLREKASSGRKSPVDICSEENNPNKLMYSESDYKTLEFKLAETKSKLARIQQYQDDQMLVKEVLEKELDVERSRRILAEKERDAYIAAYEASLKHFEKWSRTKILNGRK